MSITITSLLIVIFQFITFFFVKFIVFLHAKENFLENQKMISLKDQLE